MVLFKPPLTGAENAHKESWKDRWIDGVYFGTFIRTSENLIGTDKGVFKVNALRRRPLDERWCREEIDKVQGCPHKPVPGSESFIISTFVRLDCKDTVILKSDLVSSFDNKMILPKCVTSM